MDSTYLNQAGTSWPKPELVLDAVRDCWDADPLEWPARFVTSHRQVADYFHISNPSQLLLTPACTTALSIAVFDHFWNPGDRILTSGFEHHALHRPLVKLVDQGVDVEVLPNLEHEPIILESLESSLKQGRVRLVAVTAASNVTGDLLPIRDVIELAHQYEAKVLIDAAQIAGWWDLNLPALGADLVAFAGHKGTLAPWGIGRLYVAPELKMNSPAAACEITYDKNTGKPKPAVTGPGYCDSGSVDRPALAGLAAGVRWLSEEVRADRLTVARRLAQKFYDAAAAMEGVSVYGSEDMNERMPTVAVRLEELDSVSAGKALQDRGIIVSGGMQCAPLAHKTLETAPEGVVRFSVGPMNSEDEIDSAIQQLAKLALR